MNHKKEPLGKALGKLCPNPELLTRLVERLHCTYFKQAMMISAT